MPIYEYQCDACNHQLEKIQKMNDPVLTDCPECGAPRLRKLISASAFHLKGNGWYETDFKTKKPTKEQANSDSGESKSETKSETKKTESSDTTETKKKPKPSTDKTST